MSLLTLREINIDVTARPRAAPFLFSHGLLKLEHEIVDRWGWTVTRGVVRVVWASPEVALGDNAEAGRFDFLAQRTLLDAM